MWARSASPTFPATWSALRMSSLRLPYWLIHLVAVFSPTLGTDGRLSLGSPRRAAKSGYWAGVRPYFASTAAGVIRARSETPLRGYRTVVSSSTSWNVSRSPLMISVSNPC